MKALKGFEGIRKSGLLGLSPFLVFLLFFLGGSLIGGSFTAVPVSIAFLVAAIYAVSITKGLSLPDRVRVFGRGAGKTKVMFMVWIFLVAGAFANSASAMGCIHETVNVILKVLPSRFVYASLFVAGCFISLATGSGVGSIVAIGPIAVGVAEASGSSMPLVCAIVVCGAMFGDNLSFISDTTVVATSTQGCQLKDKFRVNLWMALPASLAAISYYLFIGTDLPPVEVAEDINFIKIIPYILVILLSVIGCDVLIVLCLGALTCGILGMATGSFDFFGWLAAMNDGIMGMSDLVIIIILAAGLMALIEHNGGMEYIIRISTKFIRGRRSAEGCIAILTGLVCACTANNTIAIMSVSSIVKEISLKFGVDPRKAASLMDTGACIVQEFIPYSAHLMTAAAFGRVAATDLVPYVYYAYALLFFLIVCVVFRLPRLKPMQVQNPE